MKIPRELKAKLSNLILQIVIGQPSTSDWNRKSTLINIPINILTSGTNQFNLITQPNGAPGFLYAGVQLVYNLSRL